MSGVSTGGSGGGGGVGNIKFIESNTGGPVGPDLSGTLFLTGVGNISVDGDAGTNAQEVSFVGVLPIINGGTNANTMGNTFGVNYFDGTRLVTTTVGTSGQILTSNGAGVAPTFQAAAVSGIATINGDTSLITGSVVNITGQNSTAGYGQSLKFIGNGTTTMNVNLVDGGLNFYVGSLTTGSQIAGGAQNFLFGFNSSTVLGSGGMSTGNIAIGGQTLLSLDVGSYNIALNEQSGANLTTGDSNNILISNPGQSGDNNTIRIGSQGGGLPAHTSCYVQGIAGVAVAGAAVLVDAGSGQLGVLVSSERYKKDIVDMEDVSRIKELRPVNFTYKHSSSADKQYGLIAEEVHAVFPELVLYDSEGRPDSVKYHELPVLLLAELQKALKRIEDLESKLVS